MKLRGIEKREICFFRLKEKDIEELKSFSSKPFTVNGEKYYLGDIRATKIDNNGETLYSGTVSLISVENDVILELKR